MNPGSPFVPMSPLSPCKEKACQIVEGIMNKGTNYINQSYYMKSYFTKAVFLKLDR